MIKVEHTKSHKITDDGYSEAKLIDVLVTDAKLVLVESQYDAKFSIKPDRTFHLNPLVGIGYKPIFISETEKIEVGDWMYWNGTTKQIIEATISFSPNDPSSPIVSKILALPEHFSPQILSKIVSGELKDGDKILLEVEEI